MIELTYADTNADRFFEAFDRLLDREFDIETSSGLANSLELVAASIVDYRKKKEAICREFGVEFKNGELSGWTLEGSEKKEEGVAKLNELEATKVELPLKSKVVLDKAKPLHLLLLKKIVEVKA